MSHFFLSIYLEKWKFSSNWLARSLAQSTFLFCKQDFCSTSCHLNLLLVFHSKVRHFPTLILSTLKYYICWWNILEKSFFIINYLILAVFHQLFFFFFFFFKYLKLIYSLLWALLYSYGIIMLLNSVGLGNCSSSFQRETIICATKLFWHSA